MSDYPIKTTIVHLLNNFFTGIDGFRDNPHEAWKEAKSRYISTLEREIEVVKNFSLEEYAKMTGSNICE